MRRVPVALSDVVRADRSVNDLRTYFDEDLPLPYTGRRFDTLADGGHPNHHAAQHTRQALWAPAEVAADQALVSDMAEFLAALD